MKSLKIIKSNAERIGAFALSLGVGASAAVGFALMDDTSDIQFNQIEDQVNEENSNEISSQIDDRKQQLKTVAGSGENNMDYTRLSC